MKILGIDPASTTGWCILDDEKLTDYGVIKVDSSFDLAQRLNFIAIEMSRLVNKFKPDNVACEDLILGISGPKTLGLLGRISGVIIQNCYRELNKNITLVDPSTWKKECGLGLKGNAIKVDIQLAVVSHFNLLPQNKVQQLRNEIDGWFLKVKTAKSAKLPKKEISIIKKEMDKAFKNCQKEMHSITGITEDISDSIAIALYQNKLLKN